MKSEILAAKKAARENAQEDESNLTEVYEEIDSKHFQVILGSEASTIKKIQSKLGVRIELPKRGGIHTATCFTGSEENCAKARLVVEELISDGYSMTLMGDKAVKVPLEVSNLSVVIGPKGSHLSTLRKKTGTEIITPARDSGELLLCFVFCFSFSCSVKFLL